MRVFGTSNVLVGATFIIALASMGSVSHAQVTQDPELPRELLNTSYALQVGGEVYTPESARDLQDALDQAQPGDTILLEAGSIYSGNFTLPAKSGDGYIYIRTSVPDKDFPPPGTRVSPSDAALMPKVISPNPVPALRTASGAHHYRLVGIEFGFSSDVDSSFAVVRLGESDQASLAEVPHDLIIDRCYIHGDPDAGGKRGIELNSARTAVIDSYIADFHAVNQDSQAIGGWSGPGPFKIVNNYLEGAGENILFGGADTKIQDLVPSDIEIRRNHFYKPLSWKQDDPAYAGNPWTVKNLFELKCARRVLVEGNAFENCWAAGQIGFAIVLTPRNAGGGNPWAAVEDVTFRHNIVRHTAGGVNMLGHSDNFPALQLKRVRIENNVFEDVGGSAWGGNGRLYQMLTGTADVTITHNTGFPTGTILNFDGLAHERFVFTNNISMRGAYGVLGSGSGEGTVSLEAFCPGYVFSGNVIVGGPASRYPARNFFPPDLPGVGFVDLGNKIYKLDPSSLFRAAGTDGKDIGADIDAVHLAVSHITITSVEGFDVTTSDFRIKIKGENFQTGARIFIGSDTESWLDTKYKNSATLFLRKGRTLRQKFPVGVLVPIRIVNPDGDEAAFFFKR